MKQVNFNFQTSKRRGVYFRVYNLIKNGYNPSSICKELNVIKQCLNRYISTLKKKNLIKKIGYGTWETLKELDRKEVNFTSTVATPPLNTVGVDDIRLHAVVITVKIKSNIKNWEKRGEILQAKFKDLNPQQLNGGWGIFFKEVKIHLWDSSIVIYTTKSFYGKIASETQSYAISEIEEILRSLENRLLSPRAFMIGKGYQFKPAREHYAMVKNALAKQYRKDGSKLNIYGLNGLWLLIDYSDRVDELEVVSNKGDNTIKTSEELQNFWNDYKKNDFKPTASYILSQFEKIETDSKNNHALMFGIQQNQLIFDANMKTHLDVLDRLGKAVDRLTEEIKKGR